MKQYLTMYLIYAIIRLLKATIRIHHRSPDPRHQGTHLLAFWHQGLVPITFGQMGFPYCALTSNAREGAMIAFILKKTGFTTVAGSQTRDGQDKGGLKALLQLRKLIINQTSIAIAVDGSIGPALEVKPGICYLAARTQVPIVPVAAQCSRFVTLKTWDKMQIPKPFSTITLTYGPPLFIAPEEPMDLAQERVTKALMDLTRKL